MEQRAAVQSGTTKLKKEKMRERKEERNPQLYTSNHNWISYHNINNGLKLHGSLNIRLVIV